MRWWVVIAALIAGCKKGAPAIQSAPEQDALWKLAPLTATRGIVISGRGLLALERGWRALADVLDDAPELVALGEVWRHQQPNLFPTDEISLASFGMTGEQGAAFFFSRSGAHLFFLPVVDRAKFLAFVNGTMAEDGDKVGVLTCKTIGGRYACANPVQLLSRIGGGDLGDQIQLAGARGDIELAIVDRDEQLRAAAVAQLENGSLVLRGAVRAPGLENLVNAGAQRFDASKLAGFGVFNVGPAFADLSVSREPLAAGITLGDLIGNMTGPINLTFQAGLREGEIRVPMKNPRIARTLVEHCEDIPHLAILSSTFKDGACQLTVPGLSLDFEVSVDGADLRARPKLATGTPTTVRPTAIAKELATGNWAYSLYGRGTLVGSGLPLDQDISVTGMVGLRVLTWVTEAGIGARSDGDVLRFLVSARTVWSYPDHVLAKWLALPFDQILDPATSDMLLALAAEGPDSLVTDDLRAGTAGMAPLAALALGAGLAAGKRMSDQDLRDLGTGGQSASPDEALAQMTRFKDAMCACSDAACAQRVSNEMVAWSQEQAARMTQPPRLSAAQQATAAALGEQMSACMVRALGAEAPGEAAHDASEYIAKNLELKDRLCACKDLACGERVSREITRWSEEYVRKLPPGATMSPADDRKMQEIEDAVRACMRTLESANK